MRHPDSTVTAAGPSKVRVVGTALRGVYPNGSTLPRDMQALLDRMA